MQKDTDSSVEDGLAEAVTGGGEINEEAISVVQRSKYRSELEQLSSVDKKSRRGLGGQQLLSLQTAEFYRL